MKICMIAYSRYNDTRVQRYARALTNRGDQVDFICLATKGQKKYNTIFGIKPYPLLTRFYVEKSVFSYLKQMVFFFVLSTITCTKLHLINRYDIIHFHNLPDFGVFCTLIPKLMGAGIILDIHDIVPEFYMRKFAVSETHFIIRFLKWIEKISCHYADHVFTVTEIWRQKLIERSVKPEKCTVILNSPDPDIFKNLSNIKRKWDRNSFTLSYHGTFTEPTGVDIAIKAVSIAKKNIPNIQFFVIGKGREEENLLKLTKSLHLQNHVHFRDPILVDKIPRVLSKVDAGIDPKRDGIYSGETLSVKAMEYLAMGIPLMISKTKVAQIYFNSSMVMFFEPDNEYDLARCIIELYKLDYKKKMKMINNSEIFIKKHGWEKYKNIYVDLINEIAKKTV